MSCYAMRLIRLSLNDARKANMFNQLSQRCAACLRHVGQGQMSLSCFSNSRPKGLSWSGGMRPNHAFPTLAHRLVRRHETLAPSTSHMHFIGALFHFELQHPQSQWINQSNHRQTAIKPPFFKEWCFLMFRNPEKLKNHSL
jgi:hypothetical protein